MHNQNLAERFARLGLQMPRILLPRNGVDLERWAVIACDQFTSDPAYWRRVEERVGNAPSTLRLMLPERYLEEADTAGRLKRIQAAMRSYLSDKILEEQEEGFILVKRRGAEGSVRHGLVAAIDLESYDYGRNSTALIRATEGTISERIPPRTSVRRGAPLEVSHVLVLYDDPDSGVLGPVLANEDSLETLYDFGLMEGSGHITGFRLGEDNLLAQMASGFERLADPAAFERRHGIRDVLLFAVGDGNHSLAAAKTVWEETKRTIAPADRSNHPGRFALVELVNIHDPGLRFEAIHRVLFKGAEEFLRRVRTYPGTILHELDASADISAQVRKASSTQKVGLVTKGRQGILELASPTSALAAGTLERILDDFLASNPGARVDYIHGEEATRSLGTEEGNIGFFLPALAKEEFFASIVKDGSLPRKTFSMGEAEDKRFYLEARRILPA